MAATMSLLDVRLDGGAGSLALCELVMAGRLLA